VEVRLFLALELLVGGQADAGNCVAVLGVPQFGITGGVADQDDRVDILQRF
jgi:hypothetical protein